MARKKPPKYVDKTPRAGADEATTSYRPMGASLTLEEVTSQIQDLKYLRLHFDALFQKHHVFQYLYTARLST